MSRSEPRTPVSQATGAAGLNGDATRGSVLGNGTHQLAASAFTKNQQLTRGSQTRLLGSEPTAAGLGETTAQPYADMV